MRDETPYATRSQRCDERLRRRAQLRRRALIAGGLVLALVASIAIVTGLRLNSNISRVDIAAGADERPEDIDGDLNILVIGSDTRTGDGNSEYGSTEDGPNSDTNLLVHISADRESAYVISIPRDSMTKAPADCADPASTVDDGVMRQWNANYNEGGPACVVKALEGLTGIYVDHVAVLDFSGFQSMVDGLGGVEVCLPQEVHDKDARIDLPAGRQVLDGQDALGYVRMRKSLGSGSDLERIERQQAFMSSMAQEATRTSLLLRPDRLYSFLDAATKSMTADEDLGLKRMLSIATSVKELGMDELVFVTVPNEPYTEDTNRVQWAQPAADALWEAVRNDTPLPGQDGDDEADEPQLTVAPSKIAVRVRNDTSTAGLAAQSARALEVQGFRTSVVYEPPTGTTKGVTITHAKGEAAAARTVAAAFAGAKLKVDETLPIGTVEVSLGSGAPAVQEVPNREGDQPLPESSIAAPPAPTAVKTRAASEDICG